MRTLYLCSFVLSLALISCEPDIIEEADLHSAIPQTSVLIIETNNLNDVLEEISQTRIYLDADSIPPLLEFKNEIMQLQGLFPGDTLKKFLKNRKLIISLSPSGAEKYDLLFATSGTKDFEKVIDENLTAEYKVKTKVYSDVNIRSFYKDEKEKFSMVYHQNILVLSPNITLVEEVVRQINSDFNFSDDPEFEKLYRTANKKDLANIYLNLKELPNWFKKIMPSGESSFIAKTGTWAELDLQIYNRELLMSGLLLIPQNHPSHLHSFTGTEPQQVRAQKIIPEVMGLWMAYTFENAESYYRNYEGYLKNSGAYNRYEQQLANLNFDPKSALLHWLDNEMGVFHTEISGKTSHRVAYFRYRDRSDTEENLQTIRDTSYIEGYRGEIINRVVYDNLLPKFYGRIYKGFSRPYYVVLEDYVLFCDDETILKGVINDILAGKTLSSSESYSTFQASITSKAHVNVIASNPLFLDLLSGTLEKRDAATLEKTRTGLNNYRWGALQLNIEDEAAFVNFYMINEPRIEEEVIRQWSALLESPAIKAPQMMLNHTTKKYDVLVQDSDYRLYLISADGKTLWKKQLDGPVMGNAVQIDAFKNNKLQMVLNTSKSIYLIDRLGRDVENFPVKLPQPSTAAIGVFNYDNARNYRLVVPMGNSLLNYDIDGKPVKGWKFKEADGILTSVPQLFTIDKKDVIVVLSEKGTLYLLNRRGEERFPKIADLKNLQTPFYLRKGDELKESELIAYDDEGRMVAISFKGVTDPVFLDAQNPADQFLYFDDKYIFTHDEHLFVKSTDNPWEAKLESDISARPKAMILRREFYVAAYSEGAEEIYLFNKEGDVIKGFPVYAQGTFDMGSLKQDGSINIITTTSDGTVICYRVR